VRLAAKEICKNILEMNFIRSTHANTLAGCCLKYACDLSENCEKTIDEIAEAIGMIKMTVKNLYRDLFPFRFDFIKDVRISKSPKELKMI